MWLFYLPVVLYIVALCIRHRGLVFTVTNPGMSGAGGLLGASKSAELNKIATLHPDCVPRFVTLAASLPVADRIATATAFIDAKGLTYPVVLKPDQGERGRGVEIIPSAERLATYLTRASGDTILQQYAAGQEYGVFYMRHPKHPKGAIFSVTDKRYPVLTGDGVSSLEQLILSDPRAHFMARFFLDKHHQRLHEILPKGDSFALVETGSHCGGALFLDGNHRISPALTDAIESISRSMPAFFFGRYDIKVEQPDDLWNGKNFQILEVNGVASEAAHIYDPRHSVLYAYRVFFKQWRSAMSIGAYNRDQGHRPHNLRQFARLVSPLLNAPTGSR